MSELFSGGSSIASSWRYGEPRAEGWNPGLPRDDPTFDVASDEHSEVVTSGRELWSWSSSELGLVMLWVPSAEAKVGVGSSPNHVCGRITPDGRSFLHLAFPPIAFGVGSAEGDEMEVKGVPA